MLGSPAQDSFLRVQPPRHLSKGWCPGRLEGRGEASGGTRWWDRRAWVFAQAHSTLNSQPRKPTFLKALVPSGTRVGREEVLPLVDISCNNNLPNSTDWHLQIQKACGVANDSCPQERSLGSYCRNKVQTQLTFKTPNARGTFSSHTLRKNKEDKQFPKGYRTRCSASLIITWGIPIKITRNLTILVRIVILRSLHINAVVGWQEM